MEHRDKDEARKQTSSDEVSSGSAEAAAAAHTNPGGDGAPADRDAGTLHHGEMGGNFNDDNKEETGS